MKKITKKQIRENWGKIAHKAFVKAIIPQETKEVKCKECGNIYWENSLDEKGVCVMCNLTTPNKNIEKCKECQFEEGHSFECSKYVDKFPNKNIECWEEDFDFNFWYLTNLKVTPNEVGDWEKAKLLQKMCDKTEKDLKDFIRNLLSAQHSKSYEEGARIQAEMDATTANNYKVGLVKDIEGLKTKRLLWEGDQNGAGYERVVKKDQVIDLINSSK
jgi:hypothetical protein